jgi:hypothetical protein
MWGMHMQKKKKTLVYFHITVKWETLCNGKIPVPLDSVIDRAYSTLLLLLMLLFNSSWLRHHATSRKIADSITDEVIGFFNTNPTSRTRPWGRISL